MCLHQCCFGGARSCAGRGESDRRANAADAVQVTIRVRHMLDNPTFTASHVVGRDECVCDLALERGGEAVPYSGKADFKVIGVHGVLPWLLRSKLPRQTLIVGQVFRLIWCVDNIYLFGRRASSEMKCIRGCITVFDLNEFAAASVFVRKRKLTRAYGEFR